MKEFDLNLESLLEKIYTRKGSSLRDAVAYSLLAGGKRVRSRLCLLTCVNEGGELEDAMPPACALEMVHTYSLIHDDLPAMDNDDLRRGKPTNHKAFGEATAILAGDALLTDAFLILSEPNFFSAHLDASQRLTMIQILAKAAGSQGMVLGQHLDLENSSPTSDATWASLSLMHQLKTGQLFAAALTLGGVAAGCSKNRIQELLRAGECLGLAFQIGDDLIDLLENTGKTPGKDQSQGKLTILQIMSEADARKKLYNLTEESVNLISSKNSELEGFIYSLLTRTT